jgi:hypothetical protein
MYYVERLKRENAELNYKLVNVEEAFNNFVKFLHSPKFVGLENGERKDWISTGDVLRWIAEVRNNI